MYKKKGVPISVPLGKSHLTGNSRSTYGTTTTRIAPAKRMIQAYPKEKKPAEKNETDRIFPAQ
jgi:hypothetical protein